MTAASTRAAPRKSRPIRRQTLTGSVYERLHDDIVEGRLAPGERVVVDQVAEDLGVSITPVREALMRLQSEGFLKEEPFSGMRVWAPTAAEILQLCEVRGVLAGYAARKAAANLAPEDMEGVRAMLAELESAAARRDVAAFRKLDRGFHDAIYAGAGDHIIRREIAHMHKFVRPYERLAVKLLDESYLDASQEQHRRIVKLLERKSVDELEALVRLHAMNFGQQLARFLER